MAQHHRLQGFFSESPEEFVKNPGTQASQSWGQDPSKYIRTTYPCSIVSICQNSRSALLDGSYTLTNLFWNVFICMHWNFWHPPRRIFWLSDTLESEIKLIVKTFIHSFIQKTFKEQCWALFLPWENRGTLRHSTWPWGFCFMGETGIQQRGCNVEGVIWVLCICGAKKERKTLQQTHTCAHAHIHADTHTHIPSSTPLSSWRWSGVGSVRKISQRSHRTWVLGHD